jgi:hypothetical protein
MLEGSRPYALGPGEGRFIDLGDFGMTVKASEAETGGGTSAFVTSARSGQTTPERRWSLSRNGRFIDRALVL